MADRAAVDAMTDEERIQLLQAAAADEREGRLVRCSTAEEVRHVMSTARNAGR